MNRIPIRRILAVLLAVCCLGGGGISAWGADPTPQPAAGAVTLQLPEAEALPLAGSLQLYLAAPVQAGHYDPAGGAFPDSPTLEGLESWTQEELDRRNPTVAAALEQQAAGLPPLQEAAIGSQGAVRLEGLPDGLYLVVHAHRPADSPIIPAFLFTLPDAQGSRDRTLYPKSGWTAQPTPAPTPSPPPPPNLPQTGQLWWPLPWLAGLGLGCLVLARLWGRRGKAPRAALLGLAVVLLLGAVALTGHHLWTDHQAARASGSVLRELETALPAVHPAEPEAPVLQGGFPEEAPAREAPPILPVGETPYLGVLSIPSLELRLPVGAQWDFSGLETTPCRYAGDLAEGSLVIAGHNYASHFGPLLGIAPGAEVDLITGDGSLIRCQVSNREILPASAVAEMLGTRERDWDLTLFTCTLDGASRCAVRCVRMDN